MVFNTNSAINSALCLILPMQEKVLFNDLGARYYKEIWDYQETLLQSNAAIKAGNRSPEFAENHLINTTQHHLLFVEHFPVYTLGKSGKESNILLTENQRKEKNIEYFHINRGGDITFHGPGQVVGYPILDLEKFKTDLSWYLRSLEEVIILTLKDYEIFGQRSAGETGVWIAPGKHGEERKICAMGIRCSRWITMHGFAFNINTDLTYFDGIIPCGIQNKAVTSLQKELGFKVPLEEVKQKIKKYFEMVFDCQIIH